MTSASPSASVTSAFCADHPAPSAHFPRFLCPVSRYSIPPRRGVHNAPSEQVQRFTDQLLYLRLLLIPHGEVPPAQVLAANIREMFRQRGDDRLWLDTAAQEIASLLKDDHQTLLTVLYAIDPDRALMPVG